MSVGWRDGSAIKSTCCTNMRSRVQVPAPIQKLCLVPCVSVTAELKATEIRGCWGLLDASMDKNRKAPDSAGDPFSK